LVIDEATESSEARRDHAGYDLGRDPRRASVIQDDVGYLVTKMVGALPFTGPVKGQQSALLRRSQIARPTALDPLLPFKNRTYER
jgi:hypothetical protein